jgi:hypothetical protein
LGLAIGERGEVKGGEGGNVCDRGMHGAYGGVNDCEAESFVNRCERLRSEEGWTVEERGKFEHGSWTRVYSCL